jgi:hypothetical protein
MKQLYLSIAVCLLYAYAFSQNQLSVAPGTDLYISPATEFSSDGLSITPSSGFTINGLSLQRNTTVSHFTLNTYISRVYQFSGTTAAFSGSIQFNYLDAELNGLNESNLRLNVHDGSSWQAFNSTTNDAVNNFVLTNGISNVALNELTLADVLMALPLKWGLVAVYRQDQTIRITWNTYEENNVSHFDVERSVDGRNWITVISEIAASNGNGDHTYLQTDPDYQAQRLYYRIKEMDRDGRSNYSAIVMVNEEKYAGRLQVYPNPVISSFNISNLDPLSIRTVQLFNSSGILIKTWTGPQTRYNTGMLPTGIYPVKITLTDGRNQHTVLQKQ